jgi:hypothetical protein
MLSGFGIVGILMLEIAPFCMQYSTWVDHLLVESKDGSPFKEFMM